MIDIALDKNGDIAIAEDGNISITDSVCQAVMIRLRWIKEEWRLGPELGFSWFEDVFVKNPHLENVKQLIRNEIIQVEGVEDANVAKIDYQPAERRVQFTCTIRVNGETYNKEVTFNA